MKSCPYCYQQINWDELIAEKRRRKTENANNSRIKARKNGTKLGRPKKRDDELIYELRKQGLSYSSIAAKAGVSTAAVHRSLKGSRL